MKLEIQSVRFKNFLSYGSMTQEIPFKKGVNIVLGKDLTTGRSNGSGKSSFLETIPFALFGQTHKEIKKGQLLNWKNRKALEVALKFKKGDNEYIVARAIKPDNFEIYENNRLIEKPAHVKYYQNTIEEIIGLNFTTFCSLIHSNLNSSNKILSMGKPEKRKFIENVFGLGIYSLISAKALEKTRKIEDKLAELDLKLKDGENQIREAKSQIDIFNDKVKHFKSSKPELKESETELKELNKEFPNLSGEYDKIVEKIGSLENESRRIIGINQKVNSKHILVERWIKEVDSDLVQAAATAKYQKEYLVFAKKNGNPNKIIDKIELLKVDAQKTISDLTLADTKSKAAEITLTRISTKLEAEEAKYDGLKFHGECPTCGQELKSNKKDVLSEINDMIKLYRIDHKNACIIADDLFDDRKKITDEQRKVYNKLNKLETVKDKLYELKDKIKTEYDKKTLEKKRLRYINVSKCLGAQLGHTETTINKLNSKMIILDTGQKEMKTNLARIKNKENDINILKEKVANEKKIRESFFGIIKTNQGKIEEIKKDFKLYEKKRFSLINIVDYLKVIRDICKDDNIKQYAISSIMPYLNQRTNYYLSEVGYSFYTILNKWIEAEIKGPGVTNASYGSLSGGEGRGIDLALQFALLDIAKVQAGIWPDILIMDEILDSSVDGLGIDKLMDIIRTKQIDEDNKIFIISHRDEVGDINPDNTYYVRKDGFSKIEVK